MSDLISDYEKMLTLPRERCEDCGWTIVRNPEITIYYCPRCGSGKWYAYNPQGIHPGDRELNGDQQC